jgi:pyruvate carboxylase subunit B
MEAGLGVLVTEAMIMGTEITAPITVVIETLYVLKEEAVNPDEVFVEIVAARLG